MTNVNSTLIIILPFYMVIKIKMKKALIVMALVVTMMGGSIQGFYITSSNMEMSDKLFMAEMERQGQCVKQFGYYSPITCSIYLRNR